MMCANLEGANLQGANFEDPAGTSANLEGAVFETKFLFLCVAWIGFDNTSLQL